jgi:hypothetical protein
LNANVPELTGYQATAAELRRIADAIEPLVLNHEVPYVTLSFLPSQHDAPDAQKIVEVDTVASAVLGCAGRTEKSGNSWYHIVRADRAGVHITVQERLSGPFDEHEVELERLRARVAELEARGLRVAEHYDPTADERVVAEERKRVEELGLNFTRADDDTVDPTPTGPREPLHTGGMTESGLVDETGGYWPPVPDYDLPLHFLTTDGSTTLCGVNVTQLRPGEGYVSSHGAITCQLCAKTLSL